MHIITGTSLWDVLVSIPADMVPIRWSKDLFGYTVECVDAIEWVNTQNTRTGGLYD